MRWIQWLAIPALCLSAHSVFADSKFNVVAVSVAEQHNRAELEAASGFQVALDVTLADEFLIGGSFARYEPESADHTQHLSAYVGLHATVKRMLDTQVAALIGARQSQLVINEFEQDDTAGMIAVSLRSGAFDRIELRADLEYLDWREGESGFAGLVGASYFVTDAVAAQLHYRKQGDSEFYSVGLGWHF